MAEGNTPILRVAVAAPLPRLFDYLPPATETASPLAPGMRVRVPFGRRSRVGMLVEVATDSDLPPDRLKPVETVLDQTPLLTPSDLALVLWAATYYRHPPGDALFSALPAGLRRARPAVEQGEPGWRLTREGRDRDLGDLRRSPRQAEIIRLLRLHPDGLPAAEVTRRFGRCPAALRSLAQKGWAETCRLDSRPEERMPRETKSGPKLNTHQAAAVATVRDAFGLYRAFLLDGVTGSGKTEVYLQLLESALAEGRQALVLVPEIGLTPQLARRLGDRIAAPVVTLHSSLSNGERERAWRSAAAGDAAVVMGTRSAVFTPLPRLGLILVDEEHDLSFKQQDGFRYSARDLAVRRGQQAACPVVLGSATPSLETLQNARCGRYELLELPERAGGARPPEIALLDIRSQPLRAGLSPVLLRMMGERFDSGEQVLLFLNRRGFAPVLTCHDCGWVGDCPHCDARLTLHLSDNRLWCHHCGLTRPVPHACPGCGKSDLRPLGLGTERLEGEIRDLFPGIPLARVDRDSTRRKGALERLLTAARRGDYPLLVGTQMLAKGHHFPGVTLVGILDIDQGLYGADFRAPERMAQLVIQVAGRAGRAQRPGKVVLQTRHPDHPLMLTLLRQGYPAFAAAALAERRAAELPPFCHQALMRAESFHPTGAQALLLAAAAAARDITPADVQLFGPVPAPMERRGGRYRSQLLVQSPQRPSLQHFLGQWLERIHGLRRHSGVRWSLDVDPQEML